MALFRRDGIARLTPQAEVVFALLADVGWKVRAVEEITIGSALSVESRRSFQCADVGAALGPLRPRQHQASLLLPVTTLPKRPLLGFDVSAPDRVVANVPPRGALAELEADFVLMLAADGGVRVDTSLRTLLVKVCEFSPGKWERWAVDHEPGDQLRTFVEAQTGWLLSAPEVAEWCDVLAPARAALGEAIGLPADAASSAENPVLVVPLLRDALGLQPADVLPLLKRYVAFVEQCARLTEVEPFAPHAVLAEYGRRWEVMIECTVPLDGPFMVRLSERRPLDLDRRGWAELDVTTGDALSNHTVIRVTDENVVIDTKHLDALTIDGAPVPDGEFEGIRATREEVATYASGRDREYRVRLRLKLAPVLQVRATNALIAALTGLSAVLVVVGWGEMDAADLAVLVIPTTFAASLAVTRERTTLATHLLGPWRVAVIALTGILWLLVGAYYVSDTRSDDRCQRISVTPPVLADPQHLPRQDARRCDGQEHR